MNTYFKYSFLKRVCDGRVVAIARHYSQNCWPSGFRELEQTGLIERIELPPPAASTVYRVSEAGWRKVLLGFDHRTDLNASYRVDIDGRRYEFAVQQGI